MLLTKMVRTTTMEKTGMKNTGDLWRRVQPRILNGLINMSITLMLILSSMIALKSILEIDSRRQLRGIIQEQIADAHARMAEIALDKSSYPEAEAKIAEYQREVEVLNTDMTTLRIVSNVGAAHENEMVRRVRLRYLNGLDPGGVIRKDWLEESAEKFRIRFDAMRDDSLLCSVMFFFAVTGSCLSAFRTRRVRWRRIVVGGSGGLIAFIIIKGGKFFFLQGDETSWIQYNAYSFAVAGLLTGMFSNTAYRTLHFATGTLVAGMNRALRLHVAGDKREVESDDDESADVDSSLATSKSGDNRHPLAPSTKR